MGQERFNKGLLPQIRSKTFVEPIGDDGSLHPTPELLRLMRLIYPWPTEGLHRARRVFDSLDYSMFAPSEQILGMLYGEEKPIEQLKQQFSSDYRSAVRDANNGVQIVIDTLHLPDREVGLHGETQSARRLGTTMENMMSPQNDDNYRFVQMRTNLLAYIALELNISHRVNEVQDRSDDFMKWMNTEIFSTSNKKSGYTEKIVFYSLHDPDTLWNSGETRVGIPFTEHEREGKVMKMQTLNVRECELDGKKYKISFDNRKKKSSAALLKAVRKTLLNERRFSGISYDSSMGISEEEFVRQQKGYIDVAGTVEDVVGAEMAVIEGNKDEFSSSLRKRLVDKFTSVTDKSQVGKTKEGKKKGGTQSDRNSFTRFILNENLNMEVIVNSRSEFLNRIYDIADKGASHYLYELNRLQELARLFFPHKMYPNLDINSYALQAQEEIKEYLRNEYTV